MSLPVKLCECGCGAVTGFARQTEARRGIAKGEPLRFLPYHNLKGPSHHGWNNGRSKTSSGYQTLYIPWHPRADKKGYVLEHVVVAEKAARLVLRKPIVVHHINGVKYDNRPENLVICEDQQYHLSLHKRERALKSCGRVDFVICNYCGKYDHPSSMYIAKIGGGSYHTKCQYARRKERNVRT